MGTKNQGQGHETTFKQILHERLGLDPGDVRYIDGDTDRVAFGMGTMGSRSTVVGGSALWTAADKVIAGSLGGQAAYGVALCLTGAATALTLFRPIRSALSRAQALRPPPRRGSVRAASLAARGDGAVGVSAHHESH